MLKRVITSVIGLPILFIIINLGNLPLQIAVGLCAVIGLSEFYGVMSQKNSLIHYLGYVLSIGYIVILNNFTFAKFILLLAAFMLLLLIFMVMRSFNIIDCIVTLFGFFYITFLLSFIVLVRRQPDGDIFVWLIFITGWGCDTFAYFFGKLFGKHKLISLSPNKTIEGSIGGVIAVIILSSIYAMFTHKSILLFVAIGLICSVFAQLGDLSASAIKRYSNVKDYGNIIPGHGGFIDRFDSILFTAPVVYIILHMLKIYGGALH